jgi:hypothetical protein
MITSEVVENNKASWVYVTRFIEEFPDNDTSLPWKVLVRAVIQASTSFPKGK